MLQMVSCRALVFSSLILFCPYMYVCMWCGGMPAHACPMYLHVYVGLWNMCSMAHKWRSEDKLGSWSSLGLGLRWSRFVAAMSARLAGSQRPRDFLFSTSTPMTTQECCAYGQLPSWLSVVLGIQTQVFLPTQAPFPPSSLSSLSCEY